MALPNPYYQYKQQQVNTASQDKLLLMLFDGAIRFCNQAICEIECKENESAHQLVIKAQNILLELMSSLNMDYEISHNLYSLYEYFHHRLVEANIRKDGEIIKEVVKFLTDLRHTWAEAATLVRSEKVSVLGGGGFEG